MTQFFPIGKATVALSLSVYLSSSLSLSLSHTLTHTHTYASYVRHEFIVVNGLSLPFVSVVCNALRCDAVYCSVLH